MSDVWYLYNEDENEDNWIKLKLRPDLSGLDDVFEYMEDVFETYDGKRVQVSGPGMTLSVYYGCMGTLIKKGELITGDEYEKQKDPDGEKNNN